MPNMFAAETRRSEQRHIWNLECFDLSDIELYADHGASKLVQKISRLTFRCGAVAVVLLATAIYGALYLLSDRTWSWVPALSVIFGGMSFCAFLANRHRLNTAILLGDPDRQPPQELVDRWVVHLQGVDQARNRDENERIDMYVLLVGIAKPFFRFS